MYQLTIHISFHEYQIETFFKKFKIEMNFLKFLSWITILSS